MTLGILLLLCLGLGMGVTLFIVVGKLLRGSYFSRKTWYSYSNVKPPSSCCSARRRINDDRMSIF